MISISCCVIHHGRELTVSPAFVSVIAKHDAGFRYGLFDVVGGLPHGIVSFSYVNSLIKINPKIKVSLNEFAFRS